MSRVLAAPWRISADALVLAVIGAFGLTVGILVTTSGSSHVVLFVGLIPIVVAVIFLSPRKCLYGLVVWTVSLGLLRRILPGGGNAGFSGDPLLLVAPIVLALLFVSAAARGGLRGRSPLANAVGLLTLIGLVEAANPLQGGLRVGLGGILYLVLPILAFWIGRAYLDERTLRRILWLVAVLAALDAIYGLVQTLGGLPSWDARWVQTSGFTALNVGGVTRAFGSFSSSQEYATFLGIGLVCWVALVRRGGTWRVPVALAAVGLIGAAVVLDSGRGAVVLTVVALFVMLAARTGRRLGGAAIAGIVAIGALVLVAGQFAGGGATTAVRAGTTAGVAPLTSHLVSGLASPTGSQSTLGGHATQLVNGLVDAVTQPLGHGTGSVTVAAGHFGSAQALGTENDPGNAGVAFGLLGLLVYLVIAVRGLTATYGLASDRRDAIGLAAIGIIIVAFLEWLNGDLYSVTWLVWLVLGWVDINYPWRRNAALSPARSDAADRRTVSV